jgi:hypothetical protein
MVCIVNFRAVVHVISVWGDGLCPSNLVNLKINKHCEVRPDKIPGHVKSIPINKIQKHIPPPPPNVN